MAVLKMPPQTRLQDLRLLCPEQSLAAVRSPSEEEGCRYMLEIQNDSLARQLSFSLFPILRALMKGSKTPIIRGLWQSGKKINAKSFPKGDSE